MSRYRSIKNGVMKIRIDLLVSQEQKADELPYVFYPWRRFLARTLDISIYNLIWTAFLMSVFHINMLTRGRIGQIFDTLVSFGIMLFIEPLLLSLFGTTPGKAIFGLKIVDSEGRPLNYRQGLERTWRVIGIGMGYNIPIYYLVRLWKSYKLCSQNERLPWDESTSYTIKDTKRYRGLLLIGAYAIIFALFITAFFEQQLPPNRGNLTVADFVENYNYYADFYGLDSSDKYLDKSGKWEKRPFDGTAYIEIGYAQMPEYIYTIENGYVTGVSFVIELKNNQDWLGSYTSHMFLASLSLAGAQDEVGLFSQSPRRIAEHIKNNIFKDFYFVEFGIEFECDIKFSGYKEFQSDILIPDENAPENYFRLEFSASKLNSSESPAAS